MRPYLGHLAMFLLGLTVSVTFYEGRRLIQTTAEALAAASSLDQPEKKGGTDTRREQRRSERREVKTAPEARPRPGPGEVARERKARDPDARPGRRGRRRRGGGGGGGRRLPPQMRNPDGTPPFEPLPGDVTDEVPVEDTDTLEEPVQ